MGTIECTGPDCPHCKAAMDGFVIVVTVETSGSAKRYVVVDNEDKFNTVPSGLVPVAHGTPALGGTVRPPTINDIRLAREEHLGRFHFGARWLRAYGRVDEMYRTLSTWEVIKVERIPETKVFGAER